MYNYTVQLQYTVYELLSCVYSAYLLALRLHLALGTHSEANPLLAWDIASPFKPTYFPRRCSFMYILDVGVGNCALNPDTVQVEVGG